PAPPPAPPAALPAPRPAGRRGRPHPAPRRRPLLGQTLPQGVHQVPDRRRRRPLRPDLPPGLLLAQLGQPGPVVVLVLVQVEVRRGRVEQGLGQVLLLGRHG